MILVLILQDTSVCLTLSFWLTYNIDLLPAPTGVLVRAGFCQSLKQSLLFLCHQSGLQPFSLIFHPVAQRRVLIGEMPMSCHMLPQFLIVHHPVLLVLHICNSLTFHGIVLISKALIAIPAMDDATIQKPRLLYRMLHDLVVAVCVNADG